MEYKMKDSVIASDKISVQGIVNTPSVFLKEYYKHRALLTHESTGGEYLVLYILLIVEVRPRQNPRLVLLYSPRKIDPFYT